MNDNGNKIIKAYEQALKEEERKWSSKSQEFNHRLAYADRWYSQKKYNEILKDFKIAQQIHNKYLDGLQVVADMIIEAIM